MKYIILTLIGLLFFYGCEDSNKDTNSTITGSEVIEGCTDSNASNYNPNATDDDGSCTYPSPARLRIRNWTTSYGTTREYIRMTCTIENTGELASYPTTYTPCMYWDTCGSGMVPQTHTYYFSSYNIPSIEGGYSIYFQTDWEKVTSLPVYPCSMKPDCFTITGY